MSEKKKIRQTKKGRKIKQQIDNGFAIAQKWRDEYEQETSENAD